MKKLLMIPALLAIFLSCGDDIMDAYKERWGGLFAGDTETYTADGVSFVMAYVPGGNTFPTGTGDTGTPATVDNAYWIAETEVTYELWHKVHTWATTGSGATGAGQYTFANLGIQGDNGSRGIQHPVTTVNWRDSMVWCNALTEWYNAQKGTSYECMYTYSSAIIRDSRDTNDTACDGAVASSTAKGFRLLTSNEWELAARWRDDATNTVSGYTNPYFTKGNSASGALAEYTNASATGAVAVYGTSSTAVVKSKLVNALGLYDMSGNVWELCFDLVSGFTRVRQGGNWSNTAFDMQVGSVYGLYSYIENSSVGFRFARTQ